MDRRHQSSLILLQIMRNPILGLYAIFNTHRRMVGVWQQVTSTESKPFGCQSSLQVCTSWSSVLFAYTEQSNKRYRESQLETKWPVFAASCESSLRLLYYCTKYKHVRRTEKTLGTLRNTRDSWLTARNSKLLYSRYKVAFVTTIHSVLLLVG